MLFRDAANLTDCLWLKAKVDTRLSLIQLKVNQMLGVLQLDC